MSYYAFGQSPDDWYDSASDVPPTGGLEDWQGDTGVPPTGGMESYRPDPEARPTTRAPGSWYDTPYVTPTSAPKDDGSATLSTALLAGLLVLLL